MSSAWTPTCLIQPSKHSWPLRTCVGESGMLNMCHKPRGPQTVVPLWYAMHLKTVCREKQSQTPKPQKSHHPNLSHLPYLWKSQAGASWVPPAHRAGAAAGDWAEDRDIEERRGAACRKLRLVPPVHFSLQTKPENPCLRRLDSCFLPVANQVASPSERRGFECQQKPSRSWEMRVLHKIPLFSGTWLPPDLEGVHAESKGCFSGDAP